jgi:hypothetical protein
VTKLKLFKQTSLVGADSIEAGENIIRKKSESYEHNEAKLKDYIGNAFNKIQDRINDLTLQKASVSEDLKRANVLKDTIKQNVATVLTNMGIEELTDKTSEICSSIKITPEAKPETEIKEVSLSATEMRDLLKANGLSTTKVISVESDTKPSTISIRYKKGKGVSILKPKDADMILTQREIEDES